MFQRSKAKGGAHRLLSNEQELDVVTFMEDTWRSHAVLNTQTIQAFVKEKFGIDVKQPWVSKFVAQHGYSSKITQIRPAKRDRECIEQEVADYRRSIDSM